MIASCISTPPPPSRGLQMVDQLVLTKPEGSFADSDAAGKEHPTFSLDKGLPALRQPSHNAEIAKALGDKHARWSKRKYS